MRLSFSTEDVRALEPASTAAVPEPVNGSLVAETIIQPPRADDLVIAAADWLTQAGDAAGRWFALLPRQVMGNEAPAPAAATDVEPIVLTRDDSPLAPAPGEAGGVVQAQFGIPLAVGLASLITLRYHQPFRRMLTRRTHPKSPAFRGPHR
jgi:hypothetical protein